MFTRSQLEWGRKKIKAIVDHYGHPFFVHKKILDLGCGHGDIGGVLHRLGGEVTVVDARQEHLKIASKKYAGVKTIRVDLDGPWPFYGKTFDLTIDVGLLCHLKDFETHLKAVCTCSSFLVLETAVLDYNDPDKIIVKTDNKTHEGSFNGFNSRISVANIEKVLKKYGMSFKRVDNAKLNAGGYVYDWAPSNNNSYDNYKRRLWFCINETVGTRSINNAPTNSASPPKIFTPPPIDSRALAVRQPIVATSSPKPPRQNNIFPPNNSINGLSICTYCKDETPYLEEWLNFHRCVGVDHFYIYDNLSKIPVTETLKKYINAGFVDVIDFPGPGRQLQVHQHYIDNFKTQSEWCAFIDIDEFIVPKSTDNIKDILKNYQPYGALCVPWVKFSSSGHLQKPVGLVMESYTLSMADTVVKVIGHMPHIIKAGGNVVNAHIFTYQNGFCAVDEQYKRVILDHAHAFNKIQINHYLFRSKQEFEEKLKKSQISTADEETSAAPARNIKDFHEANAGYKRIDKSIFKFIENTKKLYL